MSTLKKLDAITIQGFKERLPLNDSSYCVSELIKNSIDAGSTTITVQINLAKHWLQVADNGCGITKKNIKTIGDQYYTNRFNHKIQIPNKDIKTYYGHRGEFLSRIVGMCEEVIIETLPNPNKEANIKIFKNGSIYFLDNNRKKIYATRNCKGTTVSLNNLFYNKPKDKIVHSSYEQIKHVIQVLAIINHNLTFILRDTTKPLVTYTTKGTDRLSQKFKSLFNLKSYNIHYVSCSKSNIIVELYLSTKLNLKNNLQFIFINKLLYQASNNTLYTFVNNEISLHIDKFDFKQLKSKSSIAPSKLYRKNPIYVINIVCLNIYNENVIKNCIKKCIETFIENYLKNSNPVLAVKESNLSNENFVNEKIFNEEILNVSKNNKVISTDNTKNQEENKTINKNNNELIIDLQKLFFKKNEQCLLENNSNKLKSINVCLLWLNNLPKSQHPYIEDNFPNDLNEEQQFKNTLNKDKFTHNEDITMFLNQIKTHKKIKNKSRKKQQISKYTSDKKLLWSKILKSNKKLLSKDEKLHLAKKFQFKNDKKIEPKKRKCEIHEENEILNTPKKNFNESQYAKLFQRAEDDDTSNLDDLNALSDNRELSQFHYSMANIDNKHISVLNFSIDDSLKQTSFFENVSPVKQKEKLRDYSFSHRQQKDLPIFECKDIAITRNEMIENVRHRNTEELPTNLQTCTNKHQSNGGVTRADHRGNNKIIIDQHNICKNIDCCNQIMSHQCKFVKHNNPHINYMHMPMQNNLMEHRSCMNRVMDPSNINCQQLNNECKAINHHCNKFNDSIPNGQICNHKIIKKQIEFDINLLNHLKNQSKLQNLTTSTTKLHNHCCQCCCNY